MPECTLELLGLSSVSGKRVVASSDYRGMSSDGGLLLLRKVEERIGLAERLAGCFMQLQDKG